MRLWHVDRWTSSTRHTGHYSATASNCLYLTSLDSYQQSSDLRLAVSLLRRRWLLSHKSHLQAYFSDMFQSLTHHTGHHSASASSYSYRKRLHRWILRRNKHCGLHYYKSHSRAYSSDMCLNSNHHFGHHISNASTQTYRQPHRHWMSPLSRHCGLHCYRHR